LAKRSAKDTLARATYNDFTSNDAGNFEKAEKEKIDDTVRSPPPTPKRWRSGWLGVQEKYTGIGK